MKLLIPRAKNLPLRSKLTGCPLSRSKLSFHHGPVAKTFSANHSVHGTQFSYKNVNKTSLAQPLFSLTSHSQNYCSNSKDVRQTCRTQTKATSIPQTRLPLFSSFGKSNSVLATPQTSPLLFRSWASTFANELVKGDYIKRKGKLYQISHKPEHSMKGRGGAAIFLKTVDVLKGTKSEERLRSDEKVEVEDITVTYGEVEPDEEDPSIIHFISSREENEDYELPADFFPPELARWIHPNITELEWKLLIDSENEPILVEIGQRATICLQDVPPGSDQSRDHKIAHVAGMRFKVPGHVNEGDYVVVNPQTGGSYVSKK